MTGFGLRIALRWSSLSRPFLLCSGLGSGLLTLYLVQVCLSHGRRVCPRSSLFAPSVLGLIDSSGFNGCICSSLVVLRGLVTQFAFAPRFSSLRVPAFFFNYGLGPHAHHSLVGECTGLTRSRALRRVSERCYLYFCIYCV